MSTKVGRLLTPTPDLAAAGQQDSDGFAVPATHRREWDFSRDGILRSIEESLNRLQLDRLDIVYLHDPDEHWHEASTTGVDTLVELRDESVIGAIGAGMNQTAMLTRFVRECDVDVVMVAGRFTLLDRTALDDLLPAALERGVAVVAAAVYNSGLLSSSSISDDAVFDYEQASPDVIAAARSLATTCRSVGVDLPAAAVQFPLRHPAVESVVVGMRSAAQVRSTAARFRSAIQDDAWRALESSA
ncbi:D-threo-aldose 1-dehydrogenase [Agromyces atrinae]|uniref:D-threo-aldose 1-dehydrogenase n=1 Tax=Agromyces atrinae TaxID=592376 RepID=A0A852SGR7_9MICO|nr:D-threo-aldose 1-dehydrogenase [Agromyces atrinae]